VPKITVQVARQRYARVTVLEDDPEKPGEQRAKRIVVNRKRRKGDAPIYKVVKANDKNQPLPPRKCERCGAELTVGEKYRSIGIKRQYGGIIRYRCMACPSWQPHEYSDAAWARVAQIQNGVSLDSASWETEEDAKDAASAIAEEIREFASEKQESADNVGEHFPGSEQAETLAQFASDLEEWADRVENAVDDADDFPEGKCENCEGEQMECSTHEEEGHDPDCDGTEECMECNGSGEGEVVDPDELETWRESVAQAIQDEVDNAAESQ
jgi:hypothetical protein